MGERRLHCGDALNANSLNRTLLDSRQQLTLRVEAAIKAAAARGVPVRWDPLYQGDRGEGWSRWDSWLEREGDSVGRWERP